MVAVETVVAAVSVATVVAAAAGAFGGSFWGVELGYVPQLLAAPTARASALYNHHHLPLSADNGFWNCLKALPSWHIWNT